MSCLTISVCIENGYYDTLEKFLCVLSAALRSGSVHKLGVLRFPYQCNGSDGAVTLFGYDYLCLVGMLRILIILIITVQEHYHVGILLDGSRLTKVGEHGPVILPGLAGTGQL